LWLNFTLNRGIVETRNNGISRNMAEYHRMWRNITEYRNILTFSEYAGTSQYFPMVTMRLFINKDVWQHILLQMWCMDLSHFDGK
jgi:hypothetical protein